MSRHRTLRDTPEFRRGRNGERLVADLLRRQGWYVIPSYDYSGEDNNKAPRLEGAAAAYPVPDLDISRDGIRRWAEVKTKAAATFYRKGARYEHGIPKRHYESYLEVQRITGCEVWLFVYEEATGEVLYGRLDDLSAVKREYLGDKMSRGGMVFFPRTAFKVFARLRAAG